MMSADWCKMESLNGRFSCGRSSKATLQNVQDGQNSFKYKGLVTVVGSSVSMILQLDGDATLLEKGVHPMKTSIFTQVQNCLPPRKFRGVLSEAKFWTPSRHDQMLQKFEFLLWGYLVMLMYHLIHNFGLPLRVGCPLPNQCKLI
jgi:hypothetical protein